MIKAVYLFWKSDEYYSQVSQEWAIPHEHISSFETSENPECFLVNGIEVMGNYYKFLSLFVANGNHELKSFHQFS